MAGETERRKAQNIILENRSRLSVSGVEEVSGFDESIVQMQTELGALTVHGSNLRVETLSVDSGDLLVVGDISDLSYADVPVRRGWWARLFGAVGESTARRLVGRACAFVTGAALGVMRFPVYILRQVFYRLAALWDVIFYALAGLAVFAAGQWCSGGVRPRFLTAAIVGCALCTYLLTPLRRPVRRLAERKREHREEQRCRKENERKKTRKKDEKI